MNTIFKIERLREVQLPSRSYDAAAGWDFYVPDSFKLLKPHFLTKFQNHVDWESKVIPSHRALFIPSGLRIEMQDGWSLKLDNKSGIALRGLLVGATIIDQDYQGEIHLHLWNVSNDDIIIKAGQKILQGIFFRTYAIELKEETNGLFTNSSSRGTNGLGSTQKIN